MYYIYVLKSNNDDNLYVGYTSNLKRRVDQHNKGEVGATRNRIPLILIYYEACLNKHDALKREKYFKTGFGRRFLGNRLENFQACDGGRGKSRQKLQLKIDEKRKRIIIEDLRGGVVKEILTA